MAWRRPTSLNDWVKILTRHRKKAFFPGVLAALAVTLASYQIPRQFSASAQFYRRNDSAMEGNVGGTMKGTVQPIRRALAEDIKGRVAVEQLVEDLSLTKDLPRNTDGTLTSQGQFQKLERVKEMQSKINISYTIRSNEEDRMAVSFSSAEPSLPPKVVNRLVDNYIRKVQMQISEMLLSTRDYNQQETDRFRAREQELSNKKLAFERDNAGVDPNDPLSLATRRIELVATLGRVSQELEVKRERKISQDAWIKGQEDTIAVETRGTSPVMAELLERRRGLDRDIEAMVTVKGMTDEHPQVKKAREALTRLDERIAVTDAEAPLKTEMIPNEQKKVGEREVEALAGELVALARQKDELTRQLEELDIRNRNFFAIRNEYETIKRQLAEATEDATRYNEALKNAQRAVALEAASRGQRFEVTSRAPDLAQPTKPGFSVLAITALCVGLGVAALVILIAELMDTSFHTVDQAVDDLKLPVLGTVSEIVSTGDAIRRRLLDWGIYPAVAACLMLMLAASTYLMYMNLTEPHRFNTSVARNLPGPIRTLLMNR